METPDPSPRDEAPVAVVTGGHGALGQATAAAFRDAGWIARAPGRGELDVASPDSVAAYFADLPRCDALVLNAGITRDHALARMGEAAWDEVIGVNLRGAVRCCRAALPAMERAGRGHVIAVGSFSARSGPAGQANYAAAKAALAGFIAALAAEVGPSGIQANLVLPGFLKTRLTAGLLAAVRERALAAHVLGRFNTPEEAGRFIACLAGFRHISGQVFQLDSRLSRWT